MRNRVFLCGALLLSFSLAVTLTAAPTTRPSAPATTQSAKPINMFCPVERDNPVDETVPTVIYQGKVIGFCCEDCIPKFKKNPAFYMKDLK